MSKTTPKKTEKGLFTGYNTAHVPFAVTLRKSMTRQEKHLWYDYLSTYPIKFYRQRPIGKYIADFYCSQAKLVIELDGSQHYTDDGVIYDANRTAYLQENGVEVLRISNRDIDLHFPDVCARIDTAVKLRLTKGEK